MTTKILAQIDALGNVVRACRAACGEQFGETVLLVLAAVPHDDDPAGNLGGDVHAAGC